MCRGLIFDWRPAGDTRIAFRGADGVQKVFNNDKIMNLGAKICLWMNLAEFIAAREP
jgi:hypothetical protein